jgi:hypothetical protein
MLVISLIRFELYDYMIGVVGFNFIYKLIKIRFVLYSKEKKITYYVDR